MNLQTIKFSELPVGECFITEEMSGERYVVYIKIATFRGRERSYNAKTEYKSLMARIADDKLVVRVLGSELP